MDDKNEVLKDILEGDYKFVLISGEYFGCPSCNNVTSFSAHSFYDEKYLLEHILKAVGKDRLQAIWVLDCYGSGNMVKYCDIKTSTGNHNVQKIEFDLPSGRVIVVRDKDGFRQLTPEETVLYASSSHN